MVHLSLARGVLIAGLLCVALEARAQMPPRPPAALSVKAGVRAVAMGAEAEWRTGSGLVLAAGPSFRTYPDAYQVGAALGYHIPLGARWGLRPGLRFDQLFPRGDSCTDCDGPLIVIEAALRYETPSGFLLEFGLPVMALVNASDAERPPHLTPFILPQAAILGSILIGYAFTL
jgi:hypothetical protein